MIASARSASADLAMQPGAGVFWPYAVLVLAAIFLQKLGINFQGGAVGLNALVIWVCLAWLAGKGRLEVEPLRLLLFVCALAAMVISVLVNENPLKLSALLLLLLMYAGLVFKARVDRSTAMRCIGVFQNAMTGIACIVLAQQLVQYTIGNRYWPSLDAVIPGELQYGGFAYLRPYEWGSPYLKPNGVFFLEPSALSSYLALSLIAEIVWFKRIGRAATYLAAMVACLAVTGFAMLIVAAPFLLSKLDRRWIAPALLVCVPALLLAVSAGWLAPLLDRSAELGAENSSAYARLVAPLRSMLEQLADPSSVLSGAGPGTSPQGENAVQWPFSKLLFEYGLATAVLFHLFLASSVFQSPPSRTVAWGILIPQLFFGGGFLSPANVMPLILFCTLLNVVGTSEPVPVAKRGENRTPRPRLAPAYSLDARNG